MNVTDRIALTWIHVYKYSDGTSVWVDEVRGSYFLVKNSGAVANGNDIIAPASGAPIAGFPNARWVLDVDTITPATPSSPGTMSAEDKAFTDTVRANTAPSVAMPDTNATLLISDGHRRVLTTQTADRTVPISVTGFAVGDTLEVRRTTKEPYALRLLNNGPAGGLLHDLAGPGSVVLGFDGTNLFRSSASRPNGITALNGRDFGALGDNTTDDTDALQAWLDSAPALLGTVNALPMGAYRITRGLVCRGGDGFKSRLVAGEIGGSSGGKGTRIYWAGAPADDDAFRLATATSASPVTWSGGTLNGTQGANPLTDPRPVEVTLTGSASDYVNGSTITFSFVDVFGASVTEIFTIDTAVAFPQRLVGAQYCTQLTSIAVQAQATANGTIKAGFTGGTVLRVVGAVSHRFENLEIHCASNARRGIHLTYQHPSGPGTHNVRFRYVAVYQPSNTPGAACYALGEGRADATYQVSEIYFSDCYAYGDPSDTNYLGDGWISLEGGNAQNYSVERCQMDGCRRGINFQASNTSTIRVINCNFGNNHSWCMVFGGGAVEVHGGYAEGTFGGPCILNTGASLNAMLVDGFTWNGSVANGIVISSSPQLELRGCNFNNHGGGGIKIAVSDFTSVSSRGNTYRNTDGKRAPLYDLAGTYLLLGQIFAGSLVQTRKLESFGDVDADLGALRPWSSVPPQIAVLQLRRGGSTLLENAITNSGAVVRVMHEVVLAAATFAGPAVQVVLYVYIPKRQRLVGVVADTTTPWAHPTADTITLRIGYTVAGLPGNDVLVEHDIKTAAVVAGLSDNELGAAMTRAAAIQGGYLPTAGWSADWTLAITVLMTGTGNLTGLTGGLTRLYLWTEGVPSA